MEAKLHAFYYSKNTDAWTNEIMVPCLSFGGSAKAVTPSSSYISKGQVVDRENPVFQNFTAIYTSMIKVTIDPSNKRMVKTHSTLIFILS